jgi:hypothetical protein
MRKKYGRKKENLYIIFHSIFSGSSLSIITSMCSNCTLVLIGSLLLLIGLGVSATIISIFDTFHTHLRVVSIIIIIVSLYIINAKIIIAQNKVGMSVPLEK